MVGVPDQRLGEEICAWIELKDGETATAEEIRAFCKERVSKSKIKLIKSNLFYNSIK